MTDLMQQQREAIEALDQRFSSGNDTPVSQSRITRQEWQSIRATVAGTHVPEGVNLGFISEALADFAELIRSGNVDGAGQFSPSDLQEQSDLLAAAPDPKDSAGD